MDMETYETVLWQRKKKRLDWITLAGSCLKVISKRKLCHRAGKNENRPIFDEVMCRVSGVTFWPTMYMYYSITQGSFSASAWILFSTDYIAANLIEDVIVAAVVTKLLIQVVPFHCTSVVVPTAASGEPGRQASSADCFVVCRRTHVVVDVRSCVFDVLLRLP